MAGGGDDEENPGGNEFAVAFRLPDGSSTPVLSALASLAVGVSMGRVCAKAALSRPFKSGFKSSMWKGDA